MFILRAVKKCSLHKVYNNVFNLNFDQLSTDYKTYSKTMDFSRDLFISIFSRTIQSTNSFPFRP